MKKKLSGLMLLACAVVVLIFACNKDDNNDTPPPATTASVTIADFAFTAKSITVTAGTTVTWTNSDAAAHTVTADDGSFDSGNMNTGATFSQKFTKAGTYNYHCTYHSMMTGTVIVQ